jgi:secondary thiamine-phosphate synthase enzyme
MARTEFEFTIRTAQRHDLVNVTGELGQAVRESGVDAGIACAMVPHTTCALILNEDEPGLRQDILRLVHEVVEPLRRKAPFAHDRVDDNAAAHLTSILLQPSLNVAVVGGRPALGTWQSLFLVELDGPRPRTLRVVIR